MKKTAIYPGSFDPITRGHLDIIERAAELFDEVIILVAHNASKKAMLNLDERAETIRQSCANITNIRIDAWEGLIKDAIDHYDAKCLVRGLRSVQDFEYEMHMSMINKDLNSKCETVLLMPKPEYSFISSRAIREIVIFGGDISNYVPEAAEKILRQKLANQDKGEE